MNHCSIGVAVIGDLDEHRVLPEQWEALKGLLQDLACEHRISAENILGHREVPGAATACPGKFLDMDSLRSELRECANGELGIPVSDGASTEEEKKSSCFWRVQVGAFSTRERAQEYVWQLHQKGIDAFVKKLRD